MSDFSSFFGRDKGIEREIIKATCYKTSFWNPREKQGLFVNCEHIFITAKQ